MEQAQQLASKRANKTSAKGKRQFDKKTRAIQLNVGDRVLVRNLRETGGPGKLRAYWEKHIYIVMQQKGNNIPVYEVKHESGLRTPRVLHRNLLLPCPYLVDESEDDQNRHKKTTQQRERRITRVKNNDGGRDGQDTDDKEEELSITPAVLNEGNLILGENQLEEQNADNTQELETRGDAEEDKEEHIDKNMAERNVAPPDETMAIQKHPLNKMLDHSAQDVPPYDWNIYQDNPATFNRLPYAQCVSNHCSLHTNLHHTGLNLMG